MFTDTDAAFAGEIPVVVYTYNRTDSSPQEIYGPFPSWEAAYDWAFATLSAEGHDVAPDHDVVLWDIEQLSYPVRPAARATEIDFSAYPQTETHDKLTAEVAAAWIAESDELDRRKANGTACRACGQSTEGQVTALPRSGQPLCPRCPE